MATLVKFYKVKHNDYRNGHLLATRNLDYVPHKGTYVEFSGQLFLIESVLLNLDAGEYVIAMTRA